MFMRAHRLLAIQRSNGGRNVLVNVQLTWVFGNSRIRRRLGSRKVTIPGVVVGTGAQHGYRRSSINSIITGPE
jgi:hypothetical protein